MSAYTLSYLDDPWGIKISGANNMRMIIIIVVLAAVGYAGWRYYENAPEPVIETQVEEETPIDVDVVDETATVDDGESADDAADDLEQADDKADEAPADEQAAEPN